MVNRDHDTVRVIVERRKRGCGCVTLLGAIIVFVCGVAYCHHQEDAPISPEVQTD